MGARRAEAEGREAKQKAKGAGGVVAIIMGVSGGAFSGAGEAETVLSGHGGYEAVNGMTTIPEGTTLTIYTEPGLGISDALGNAIETGGDLSTFEAEMQGARSFLPGARIPNLTLYPPDSAITIMGNPITVQTATTLDVLLTGGMGHVHWAACLLGMP